MTAFSMSQFPDPPDATLIMTRRRHVLRQCTAQAQVTIRMLASAPHLPVPTLL